MTKKQKTILGIILSCLLVSVGTLFAVLVTFARPKEKNISQPTTEIETAKQPEEPTPVLDDVINLAFFGIDTREVSAELGDQYRSDSIIIVSIQPKANKVKFISVMRDSKVPIEGHDPQKINAAYKFGKEELALKTLNQNFNLNLDKYVTVDFGQLQSVIDTMGGVEVELTEEEAELVNEYAYGDFGYDKFDAKVGLQTLNGAQAVSYSRIRSIDSDYQRVSRQRTVLNALLKKVQGMSKLQYLSLTLKVFGLVKTNLSLNEITDMAKGIDVASLKMENYTVPDYETNPELWGGIDETGSWVWIYDLDVAGQRINQIINEE